MEYSIQKLSQIAHVSTRTLRYYDEIGLLKPKRLSSSGYRIYGQQEVDKLQQILFYRHLGVKLQTIKAIMEHESYDALTALKDHYEKLLTERKQLDQLIETLEKTIEMKEGGGTMSDKEKFKGFKKEMIEENEKKYGKEVREKYGDEAVDASNRKMLNMTEEEYNHFVSLGQAINELLQTAYKTNDPKSEEAQKLADLHKQWLMYTWSHYSKEAHRGLADMYVADERFAQYYNQGQEGLAEFLRDAIYAYTE